MNQNDAPRPQDRPVSVNFSDDMLIVRLADGREIATPLAWYPRLLHATPEQRQNVEYSLGRRFIYRRDAQRQSTATT